MRFFHHRIMKAGCVFMLSCSSNNAPSFHTRDGQVSAGAPDSAASDAQPRDANVVDVISGASPDGASQEIACGTQPCWVGREECCVTLSGASCIAAGEVCEGAQVSCDGPEDCTDGYCCVVATFTADLIMRTAESRGETDCTPSCNFAFDYDPATRQGEITARACHSGADCSSTEPVCCAVPGVGTGMCLTESAATLAEEYTYGLIDCG